MMHFFRQTQSDSEMADCSWTYLCFTLPIYKLAWDFWLGVFAKLT